MLTLIADMYWQTTFHNGAYILKLVYIASRQAEYLS